MQLALDSMQNSKKLPSETNEYITSIKEDITQVNELVRLFLLYSQTSDNSLKVTKQQTNIKNWLAPIIKHHQLAHSNIEFSFHCENDFDLLLDPKLFKHVIDNLIVNATKYASKKILISLTATETDYILSVEDDGPGIAEEDREKLFDAFSTLNESKSFGGHVGLGLSITKSIVQLHGGKILVQPSSLGGCCFVIKVPII